MPTNTPRQRLVRLLQALMEAIVLLLAAVAPWAFGSVHPLPEFVLNIGVAFLLVLWALRILVEWQLTWKASPIALCLAGLFLLGVWQLAPLSPSLLESMSPATADLNRRLLPELHEIVRSDEDQGSELARTGSTISVYAGATRETVVRLLAVLALFAVVRNNVASPASLWRLAVVCVVNGCLLSLLGLLQFFTAPPNVIYWSFPSLGRVFGPFVYRNYFAMYLNLCIGLGVGALLASMPARRNEEPRPSWSESLSYLFQVPQTLWIVAGLALMAATLAFCLSRGGILALLGGGAITGLAALISGVRAPRLGAVLLAGCLALALLAWFGLGAVEGRLATLVKGTALEESRLPLWSRMLPQARDFPIWGAGFGTFQYLEPLRRSPGGHIDFAYDHAHNDYLELLLDSGIVGLLLALAAIALVYRQAWRGCIDQGDSWAGGLALGGVLAVSTVVLHSFSDFGLQCPAIVVLVTVLSAQLCSLGNRPRDQEVFAFRLGGLAPLAGSAAVLAVALVLYDEGWKRDQVERYRLAARHCAGEAALESLARRLAYLQSATALAVLDANLAKELADARYEAHERQTGKLSDALHSYVRARDLCPLLEGPHQRLAAHARDMTRADSAAAYLARACFIVPFDATAWYLLGEQELEDGHPARAWPCWHRSLECGDTHWQQILARSRRALPASEVAAKVVPGDARLLLRAGEELREQAEDARVQRPFFQRALQALDARRDTLSVEEMHDRARVLRLLDQPARSLEAYEDLVAQAPRQASWRFEFAELLHQEGRLQESRRELRTVLDLDPGHAPARELYQRVLRTLAEGA